MNPIVKTSLLHALATTAYIAAVAMFLFYAPQTIRSGNSPLLTTAILMLLVVSAAVTGSLVFGRPALWYLDGKKQEALRLLLTTCGFLLAFTALAFALLLAFLPAK